MNQWARENPEAYEEGRRYQDGFYDKVDRLRQEIKDGMVCPDCNGTGLHSPRPDSFGNYDPCDACEGRGR